MCIKICAIKLVKTQRSKKVNAFSRDRNIIKFRKCKHIVKIRVIDQTVSLGQRMNECLEGFVSAVKALFPISTQTYHQEGKKENTLRTTHIFFPLFSLANFACSYKSIFLRVIVNSIVNLYIPYVHIQVSFYLTLG